MKNDRKKFIVEKVINLSEVSSKQNSKHYNKEKNGVSTPLYVKKVLKTETRTTHIDANKINHLRTIDNSDYTSNLQGRKNETTSFQRTQIKVILD